MSASPAKANGAAKPREEYVLPRPNAALAESKRNTWEAWVDNDVTLSDLTPASCWMALSRELTARDFIGVTTRDLRKRWEFFVLRPYAGGADVALLSTYEFPELQELGEAGAFPTGWKWELHPDHRAVLIRPDGSVFAKATDTPEIRERLGAAKWLSEHAIFRAPPAARIWSSK